jgi:competence protein ComEA
VRRPDNEVIERITALIKPSARIAPTRRVVRTRVDLGQLRVFVMLLALGLVVTLVFVALSAPQEERIPAGVEATASLEPFTTQLEVFVHVTGDVRRPGVFTLPEGSRVIDAVNAAGGLLEGADTRTINLARVLIDGEQIIVGAQADSGTAKLNINTASAAELDQLPGIGPVIAQRIISWRTENGRFQNVDQLKSVPGVGAATFASLRKLIVAQ